MKILIDNGHGINTPGKCSPDGTHKEYKWAREIAGRIVASLKAKGHDAEILVPEEGDISLGQRVARVNSWCDKLGTSRVLLISIHNNAAGNGQWMNARGWSAYTTKGVTKSDALATCLYDVAERYLASYIKNFKSADTRQRPIRKDLTDGDPDLEENFYILKNTRCPAVLTENLFQDNKDDLTYLKSEETKQAIVNLHVDGIINFINKLKT